MMDDVGLFEVFFKVFYKVAHLRSVCATCYPVEQRSERVSRAAWRCHEKLGRLLERGGMKKTTAKAKSVSCDSVR